MTQQLINVAGHFMNWNYYYKPPFNLVDAVKLNSSELSWGLNDTNFKLTICHFVERDLTSDAML